MKTLVKGCSRKVINRIEFKRITIFHLRLSINAMAIAFIVAGRKSRPKKGAGFPNAMAKKVPKIILEPPVKRPKMDPYSGAAISEIEKKAPDPPTIGTKGISLSTEYNAPKITIEAIMYVLLFNIFS